MRSKPSTEETKTQHTPGPWAVDPDDRPGMEWNNHIVQQARPNFAICFMTRSGKRDNSEAEANARLIAAAPELLAACEAALNDRMFKELPEVATLLINAIAKARGDE